MWLLDPSAWPHGGQKTPSTSEYPNEGGGSSCSLVEVLELGRLPTRFFLSSTACAGIMRRAEKRGRVLPAALAAALADRAGPLLALSVEELEKLEAQEGQDLNAAADDLFALPSEETEPQDL